MPRLRDFGLRVGHMPIGAHNAISDVPGLRVGQVTLNEGTGEKAIRSGVTVILPHGGNLFHEKVAAGVFTINGFGKATGFEQVRALGTIESPIALSSTLNVPRVADALLTYMLGQDQDIGGRAGSVNVVVGECNDGFLSAARLRPISEGHVLQAIATASSGAVSEGNVGAGTGTTGFAFKAGIGTASRLLQPEHYTLGALVQVNFGRREDLRVLGFPLGWHLREDLRPAMPTPPGSIMIVLATDAPLSPLQLQGLGPRCAMALGRVGSMGQIGSGDFMIAFSTATRIPHRAAAASIRLPHIHNPTLIDALARATIESVEEAIFNALLAAETLTGYKDRRVYALPHESLALIPPAMRHQS